MAKRPTLGMSLKKNLDTVIWAAVQRAARDRMDALLAELEDSLQEGMGDLINEAFTAINDSEAPKGASWADLSLDWNYDKARKWGGEFNAFYRGKGYFKPAPPSLHSTFEKLNLNQAASGRRLYEALGGITYQMAQPAVLNRGIVLRTHYLNQTDKALKNPYFADAVTGKRVKQDLAVDVKRFEAAASAPGVTRTENPLLRRFEGKNIGAARLLADNLVGNTPRVETFTLFNHLANMARLSDNSTAVLDAVNEHEPGLWGKLSPKGKKGPRTAADKLYLGAKVHKRQLLDALMMNYLNQDLNTNVQTALGKLNRGKR